MATVDLTTTRDRDGFVIYFGGEPNEVNTYTFANALVALSDAFREINTQVNHGFALELKLEAVAEGSFKARVREIPTSIKGALKFAGSAVVMPILVAYAYTHLIDPDKSEITIKDNEVIIKRGNDRIIVPRTAYESATNLPNKERVATHVARAISAVQNDPKVTSLGMMADFGKNSVPALMIERDDFPAIIASAAKMEGKTRVLHEEATITIIKAVIANSDRKWEFVWNGVKISASIRDPIFLTDLLDRKYLIGSGDALVVDLLIEQQWDDSAGVWLNYNYKVQTVKRFVSGPRQAPLFEPEG